MEMHDEEGHTYSLLEEGRFTGLQQLNARRETLHSL